MVWWFTLLKVNVNLENILSEKFVNMVFKNGELKGVENNAFSIEKNFDFYVINDTAFIANKKASNHQ